MGDPADDDLADRISALEETLEELQEELEPRRGPFGFPRPPTPREMLRFTDEYAIPAAIAILEANVRTLELLQAVLRGARRAPREDEIRGRATTLGRTTVERVDRALGDLQSAIEDGDLPRNAEARSLLEEARSLNEEVRDAFAPAEGDGRIDVEPERTVADGTNVDRHESTEDDLDDARAGGGARSGVEIDVDAELASIRDELDEDDGNSDESATTRDETDDSEGADNVDDPDDRSGESRPDDGP